MKATAVIYLDPRPKKDGLHNVKIRITHNRKRKLVATDVNLSKDEFEKVMHAKRRTRAENEVFIKLSTYLAKANEIINDLEIFTFSEFDELYFENRNVNKSVSLAFDKYIEELKADSRLGTAESYKYAINSLIDFKNKNRKKNIDLEFSEITVKFLKSYERAMLKQGRSKTTIGIYLRNLRAIYNKQNLNSLSPFGKGKYTIPTGRNIKKALTLDQIAKIYNYEAEPNTWEQKARDYWIFLYFSNGMNVKDFCLLKWSDINGNMLTYLREKTKRTDAEPTPIKVSLKPETWEVINRWSVRSLNKDAFIFPHLTKSMNEEEQRRTYKQVTQMINKYIKRIAKAVGIEENVTTYYARHSFATILKRSGADVSMISDLLGHSSLNTTQNYLGSFEDDQIERQTDVLGSFKKVVNN